jgi:hypothetical protein
MPASDPTTDVTDRTDGDDSLMIATQHSFTRELTAIKSGLDGLIRKIRGFS